MDIIIDFDSINDDAKKGWLIQTLKVMGIDFRAREKSQTLEEYNDDLEKGEAEIDMGDFITHEQLKKEFKSW